jgi:DNA mismatch endonuclease (patch repair protein)
MTAQPRPGSGEEGSVSARHAQAVGSTNVLAAEVQQPTTAGRSRNMAAIRRRDTRCEVAIRSALHRRGYRFRVDHRLDLPEGRVRPDIVFSRRRIAVFVDGCFFHGCPEHGLRPSIKNAHYWVPKIRGNQERDRRNDLALSREGWQIIRLWEHVDLSEAVEKIVYLIETRPTKAIR